MTSIIGPISADLANTALANAQAFIKSVVEFADSVELDAHLRSAISDAIDGANRVRSVLGTDVSIWEMNQATERSLIARGARDLYPTNIDGMPF